MQLASWKNIGRGGAVENIISEHKNGGKHILNTKAD